MRLREFIVEIITVVKFGAARDAASVHFRLIRTKTDMVVLRACLYLVRLFSGRRRRRFSGADKDLAAACFEVGLGITAVIIARHHVKRLVHSVRST